MASLRRQLKRKSEAVKVIFLLILIGVVVAGGFLGAFLWALNSGQFDDAVTPSIRITQEEPTDPAEDEQRATAD